MAAIGKGYGSECHLLRWMGRHRSVFDQEVSSVLKQAVDLQNTEGPIAWLDQAFNPKKAWADDELKGLDFIPETDIRDAWKQWWPKKCHSWDAVGWWGNPVDKIPVLVEAKAHLGELYSACAAKSHGGRPQIEGSLRETAQDLGVTNIDPWMKPHYQLANRLAILHFLRNHNYNPHLLLIYFVGDHQSDSRQSPQTVADWETPLAAHTDEMGLPAHHNLSPYIHKLFLHVSRPEPLTAGSFAQPDLNTQRDVGNPT